MLHIENYIPLEKCKDGYLYSIAARNASVGIFWDADNSFVISRWKFGDNYVFEEYHWDWSKSFGTAKPLVEIEKSPFTGKDFEREEYIGESGYPCRRLVKAKEILKYLNDTNDIYEGILYGNTDIQWYKSI